MAVAVGVRRPIPASPLVAALIAIGVLAIFARACDHGFVQWDDEEYVLENVHVKQGLTAETFVWSWTTFDSGNWHPLTWLSLEADWQLFGSQAWGFHLTNIVIHAASAVLLYLVLCQLTGLQWPSALAAGLFAVHPLRVESVAWVAERKDVLSGFFWILTLSAYIPYARRPSALRYLLTISLFATGLLAKAMLVTLPCVLLLLDYWPLRRFPVARSESPERTAPDEGIPQRDQSRSLVWLIIEKAPMLVLSAVFSIITVHAQHSSRALLSMSNMPLEARAANAAIAYVRYLGQAVWPAGLACYYPHARPQLLSASAVAAAIFLVVVTLVAVLARRRLPYLLVGWLWYLGTLIPVIGLVQVGAQAMADRYTYVPLIGILIALSVGLWDLLAWLRIPHAIYALGGTSALIACSVATLIQLGYWRDSEVLFRHALDVTRNNALASHNLGMVRLQQGNLKEAQKLFQDSAEFDPEFISAHNDLGAIQALMGKPAEAIPHYHRELEKHPENAAAHVNLADALDRVGETQEAISHYKRALAIDGTQLMARYKVGLVLARVGEVDQALRELRQALYIDPNFVSARYQLGMLLARQGNLDEAEEQFRAALNQQSDFSLAHAGLGTIQCLRNQLSEARASFTKALALHSDEAQFQFDLAHVLMRQGEFTNANVHYGLGLQLDPTWPEQASKQAWDLATGDARQRSAAFALRIAQQACEATDYQRAEFLDVLAAAYAEAGRFDDAITVARKALASTPDSSPQLPAMRDRIKLYEKRQPYRQAAVCQ
jgi:tetratricopeptide (TPR) repeat protein